MHGATIKT